MKLRTENRLPRENLAVVNQIVALDPKVRVSGQPYAQKQITTFSAALTGFALARQSNALSFPHAAWNFDLVGFALRDLAGAATHVADVARALAGPTAVFAGNSALDRD